MKYVRIEVERMNKKLIDPVDLVIDSSNIVDALKGVDSILSTLTVESFCVNDINILNGMIAAVTCLAKKHSDDIVSFESELEVNE